MGRIIINNRSDMSDADALIKVCSIISKGRVSNGGKQYCYLTSFRGKGNEYHVVTDLRKRSDSFTIYKEKNSNP